jgi:hypothetical protein
MTAIVEGFAGLMLEVQPSQVTMVIFGTSLSTPVEFAYARAFGVTLLALAVACWLTRKDQLSHTVRGIVGGLVVFEAGIVLVLGYAGIVSGLSSIFLWPFILIHLALAVWCAICLLKKPEPVIAQVK